MTRINRKGFAVLHKASPGWVFSLIAAQPIAILLKLMSLSLLTSSFMVASAQDVFQVNYFSNANTAGAPDGELLIVNPGPTDLCSMIYVFDEDQQMTECCGCLVSHAGMITRSVNKHLTWNPLTGVKSINGVITIISALENGSNGSPCDPTETLSLSYSLISWTYHPQKPSGKGQGYVRTETTSPVAALGGEEKAQLQAQCTFIVTLGSGRGVCDCGGDE